MNESKFTPQSKTLEVFLTLSSEIDYTSGLDLIRAKMLTASAEQIVAFKQDLDKLVTMDLPEFKAACTALGMAEDLANVPLWEEAHKAVSLAINQGEEIEDPMHLAFQITLRQLKKDIEAFSAGES